MLCDAGNAYGTPPRSTNNEHLSTAITVTLRSFIQAGETGETREKFYGTRFSRFSCLGRQGSVTVNVVDCYCVKRSSNNEHLSTAITVAASVGKGA
jgi:hypothetical protein